MHRIIDHPSDFLVEGKNRTFEKTLEDVAEGMFTQMGKAEEKDTIEIESAKELVEDLVIDVLSKIIAECEIASFTPKRAEVEKTGEKSIKVRIHGEKKQPENIIKGVTYHELLVKKQDNEWIIRVLFDI